MGESLESIQSIQEYEEVDRDQGVERKYLYYEKRSHHLHTDKQAVDILQSPMWGKMLFLDGVLQSTTGDEVLYHNALVHPTLSRAVDREHILILGGGEGATAREVLRWSDVKKVTMVDYDEELVKLMMRYGREWSQGAFENPRLELIYDDAWDYITKPNDYGAIIIDLTDPDLNREHWLSLLWCAMERVKKLKGSIVMNAGLYLPWETKQLKEIKSLMGTLTAVYRDYDYTFYTVLVPSFNGEWAMVRLAHHEHEHPSGTFKMPDWIERSIRPLSVELIERPGWPVPNLAPIDATRLGM